MILDINYLLSKLQREIYISIDAVNAMHTRAKFLHPDLLKFGDYLTGNTYVPFDYARSKISIIISFTTT